MSEDQAVFREDGIKAHELSVSERGSSCIQREDRIKAHELS